jgi:F-box/WD-40 domain protein 7
MKTCIADVQGHDEIVWAVEVSGARLFSASADKTIRVWDIESRRCEQVQPVAGTRPRW